MKTSNKSSLNVLVSVVGLSGPKLEPEMVYLRGVVELGGHFSDSWSGLRLFSLCGGGWGGDIGKLH